MRTCANCKKKLPDSTEPKVGRPQLYCGTPCRQAAHRARKAREDRSTGSPSDSRLHLTPPPPGAYRAPADENAIEIARDLQEELRHLMRSLDVSCGPEEPLRRVVHMQTQLDCLTAGLVGRARHRRVPWNKIGSLLAISEDSARHRFTDDYILRRLSQMTRARATSGLEAFYGPSALPTERRSPADIEDADPPPAQGSAAYNRLAPVLSMLARASQLTLQDISKKAGCSASYLSRILSGERTPSWRLTERFARVCGADPAVLRKVWETERLQDKAARGTRPEPAHNTATAGCNPAQAKDRLLCSLRTLHVRAGQPSPYDIAVISKWKLSPEQVTEVLEGIRVPDWTELSHVLTALGGMHDYFLRLWREATQKHADH